MLIKLIGTNHFLIDIFISKTLIRKKRFKSINKNSFSSLCKLINRNHTKWSWLSLSCRWWFYDTPRLNWMILLLQFRFVCLQTSYHKRQVRISPVMSNVWLKKCKMMVGSSLNLSTLHFPFNQITASFFQFITQKRHWSDLSIEKKKLLVEIIVICKNNSTEHIVIMLVFFYKSRNI